MPQPVFLNRKQEAMLERLRSAEKRFSDIPALRAKPEAIDAARKLIE